MHSMSFQCAGVHKIRKVISFRDDFFLLVKVWKLSKILSQYLFTDNRSKINSTDMQKEREKLRRWMEVPIQPPQKPMLTRQQQRYIIVPLSIHPKTKRLLWERGYIVWASGGISDIEYCVFWRRLPPFWNNFPYFRKKYSLSRVYFPTQKNKRSMSFFDRIICMGKLD